MQDSKNAPERSKRLEAQSEESDEVLSCDFVRFIRFIPVQQRKQVKRPDTTASQVLLDGGYAMAPEPREHLYSFLVAAFASGEPLLPHDGPVAKRVAFGPTFLGTGTAGPEKLRRGSDRQAGQSLEKSQSLYIFSIQVLSSFSRSLEDGD